MTRTPSCLILCSHPAAAATLRLGLGGQANDAMKMLMQSASPTHGGPRGPTTRHSARSQHRLCRPCVRLRRLTVTGGAGQIALPLCNDSCYRYGMRITCKNPDCPRKGKPFVPKRAGAQDSTAASSAARFSS